jgi:hypothetical protein
MSQIAASVVNTDVRNGRRPFCYCRSPRKNTSVTQDVLPRGNRSGPPLATRLAFPAASCSLPPDTKPQYAPLPVQQRDAADVLPISPGTPFIPSGLPAPGAVC